MIDLAKRISRIVIFKAAVKSETANLLSSKVFHYNMVVWSIKITIISDCFIREYQLVIDYDYVLLEIINLL